MSVSWDTMLSHCDGRLRSSDIRDLLSFTAQPDVISFAGGLPAPELFPVDELRTAFDAVLRADAAGCLQYGPTEGHLPLREFLAERLQRRGIGASAEEILITTGSQQGLDLLGRVLLHERATVVTESPSYVGALQAFGQHLPRFVSIPLDDAGMRVEMAVPELIRAEAGLVYTVPTFQNPSGVTMSVNRRRELLSLCSRHGVPLVEDDPYGELRYDGEEIPPLRALTGGDETIYLGTISKILAPGLRIGWVVAPMPLLARLIKAKQAADLHTDTLVQRAVLHYFIHAAPDEHIARLRDVYRERRGAMLGSLDRHFPSGARWTRPEGGLFLWVTLPAGLDTRQVLDDALTQRVAFVPGSAFSPGGEGSCCLRLNFSHSEPAMIEEGIRRLGSVIAQHVSEAAGGRAVSVGV